MAETSSEQDVPILGEVDLLEFLDKEYGSVEAPYVRERIQRLFQEGLGVAFYRAVVPIPDWSEVVFEPYVTRDPDPETKMFDGFKTAPYRLVAKIPPSLFPPTP